LGAQTHLDAADVRWLSPLPLWTGILAGPLAWALNLLISYALVKWTCDQGQPAILNLVTLAAVVLVSTGATVSWAALQRTRFDTPSDGGLPRQRARFMALLGLATSAFFFLVIVAGAVPQWMLDACR
jgi:hypothetical protein